MGNRSWRRMGAAAPWSPTGRSPDWLLRRHSTISSGLSYIHVINYLMRSILIPAPGDEAKYTLKNDKTVSMTLNVLLQEVESFCAESGMKYLTPAPDMYNYTWPCQYMYVCIHIYIHVYIHTQYTYKYLYVCVSLPFDSSSRFGLGTIPFVHHPVRIDCELRA